MDPKIIFVLKVVKFILDLLLSGNSVSSAISQAATKFNLSESEVEEIWKKHGK